MGPTTSVKAHDRRSPVYPLNVAATCGKCHQEGSPVQRQRAIHQTNILENYSESIHGEGLLKRGLIVSATCASCHTAHLILPHTDSRSSIARQNIAETCTQCHAEIEAVHDKVIRGELWEREEHVLPACVDCHQPHKLRRVFYAQGASDEQCLKCHERPDIVASSDLRSLTVDAGTLNSLRACKDDLQPVPLGSESLTPPSLRHVNGGGGLLGLPCRSGATVSREHSRETPEPKGSERTQLQGVPRDARSVAEGRPLVADLRHKHPCLVCAMPPGG